MNKEFVPYEESVALEELGFNEPCFAGYSILTEKIEFYSKPLLTRDSFTVDAPTYSQAFRWFREKYNINAVISWRDDLLNYDISLTEMKKNGYFHYKENFKTYEEAELACLKKLIEIVKNNE
jgi:hypothetical protein